MIQNGSPPILSSGIQKDLELWGGVEYTCNRVRDRYFDQMELSGHANRPTDYERFAELGIRALRMGLLWERHELDRSWRWEDERLGALRALGIRPIVGLIHHGSGPRHTSLLDPEFPRKLAMYAAQVAERYPWVDFYSPVNEPNTTARFSAMYGVWYPHVMSRAMYLRALLNQLRGTVLSMQAIRRVRADACFVQTDDLGTICGTEELRSTWELLNERQWLSYELLCGRVGSHHPMFAYMRAEGISEAEIYWFTEHACPPDIVGVNYYVTSDRYLDHRVELYPKEERSAEGPFIDTEAVRAHPEGIAGVDSVLMEAWKRYRIPVAITEVHLGASVDEQIRWFAESWEGAVRARSLGAQCVAVTAWALVGSFFWNELVTRDNRHYEPGVFDIRSGTPEPTELAGLIQQLAGGKYRPHPAPTRAGWWRQEDRMCFPYSMEMAV